MSSDDLSLFPFDRFIHPLTWRRVRICDWALGEEWHHGTRSNKRPQREGFHPRECFGWRTWKQLRTWCVWIPAVRFSKTHATLRKDDGKKPKSKKNTLTGLEIDEHKLACQRNKLPSWLILSRSAVIGAQIDCGTQMMMKLFLLITISPKIKKSNKRSIGAGWGRKSGSLHTGFI